MRAVLDTNILARAAVRSGPAWEVLETVSRPPHVLVLSTFILSELARVLHYPRLQRMHRLPDFELQAFVTRTQQAALIVDPKTSAAIVVHDPNDDPVVATAIVGQANVLCTRDRHLRHADVQTILRAHGIEVLSDTELLAILRQPPEVGE